MRKGSGRQGCIVKGCDRKHSSKGYCNLHYQRLLHHGDPLAGGSRRTTERGAPLKWILKHLNYEEEGCLTWPFADDGHGYGHFNYRGRQVKVHRFMCIKIHGSPPFPKAEVAHSCGRGKFGCVNPRHLRWATPKENQWDRLGHGTDNRGEKCGTHKLVERDVLEINSILSHGNRSHQSIADEYGVHRCTITDIAKGKNWSWLTGRIHWNNPTPPAPAVYSSLVASERPIAANDNEPRRAAA